MKIAFVHDDLLQWGGAERLLLAMHDVFPKAPIYTTVVRFENLPPTFRARTVQASWMQTLPGIHVVPRLYALLYPLAIESFDLSPYEVVVSTSTRFAHGIVTSGKTVHISYVNTPARLWWEPDRHFGRVPWWMHGPLFFLRLWDQTTALRPDVWVANSKNVRRRVRKYYNVDASVLYPAIDVRRFRKRNLKKHKEIRPFYLVVARLLPYKRIDLAVDACRELDRSLVVIGDGPEKKRLQRRCGKNIHLLGHLTDEEVVEYYQDCTAVIIPGEEDFGMVALEALAAGKPVIALQKGGVCEVVDAGETGVFFPHPTLSFLKKAILICERTQFSPMKLRQKAKHFSVQNFQKKFRALVRHYAQ